MQEYPEPIVGEEIPMDMPMVGEEIPIGVPVSKSVEKKQSFGEIFSQAYSGSETPENIQAGAMRTVEMAPKILPVAGAMTAGAAATPYLGGMGAIPAGIAAMGVAGGGAAVGEMARQKIEGEEVSPWEAVKTGATFAAGEGLFQGLGITAKSAKNYIINSPRILDKIAGILSAVTRGEYTKNNILGAMDSAGIPGAMKAIEQETEAIKFAPRGQGRLAAENVTTATKKGTEVMSRTQKGLKEMRDMAGKEVNRVDNLLVQEARRTGDNIIDLSDISKGLDETVLAVETNPILGGAINTKKLREISRRINKNPAMAVDDALATKRMISDVFEDFSNKGAMSLKERDLVNETMSEIRVKLKEAIADKAKKLGVKEFDDIYSKFGKFADDYDTELLPMFGSKEGSKFLEDRFISLSNEIVRRGNVLENIQGTISMLFKTPNAAALSKDITDLTDMLLVRSIYQDIGHAPSSGVVGLVRSMIATPVAKALVKGANITKAGKDIASQMPSGTAAGLVGAKQLIMTPEQVEAEREK